jgi:Co/Zn/Cd efflux system component
VGVIGILVYILIAKSKIEHFEDHVDILEHKISSLQNYVYELEERIALSKTPDQDEVKKKIIEMYEDGKEVLLIENTLDVPRAKIEMVLKFHKLQVER